MTFQAGEKLQRVLIGMCIIQISVTSYVAFKLFAITSISSIPRLNDKGFKIDKKVLDFDIGQQEAAIVLAEQEVRPMRQQEVQVKWDSAPKKKQDKGDGTVVEVWSKAAVGTYLWHHILEGKETLDDNIQGATIGEIIMPTFTLRYRSGPGIVPELTPRKPTAVVLVVNGRTKDKIKDARIWLNHLSTLASKPPTIVLMLGNEMCKNSWVDDYLVPKGPVVTVLVTYDTIHDSHHQWPLGVATYRQFPMLTEELIKADTPRKYLCNLRATIHANTSRVELMNIIKSDPIASTQCDIKVRNTWVSNESTESMEEYVESLLSSDLTLCPAGINTETYRVYEALSAGSTPVIEDISTKGQCDSNPWRLLKKYSAPVLWIKNWTQLPTILTKERRLSHQYKSLRRLRVSQWYEWFKLKMRDKFINLLRKHLLHQQN